AGARTGMASPSDRTPPPGSRIVLRPALAGAFAFLDAAQEETLDARKLTAWFDTHLVKQGILVMPSTVQEPRVGVVSLRCASCRREPGHRPSRSGFARSSGLRDSGSPCPCRACPRLHAQGDRALHVLF